MTASPSGATIETRIAERLRSRWRRSFAATTSATRMLLLGVAEGAAGEVEEHGLEVGLLELHAADLPARGPDGLEDPRQGAAGVPRQDLEGVAPCRGGGHPGNGARRPRRGHHVTGQGQPDLLALADERHELLARALGADLAAVDDPDAVAEALGLLHVVRGVQDGHAAGAELGDGLEDRIATLWVDAHGGLV